MDRTGIVGEILETGQTNVRNVVKSAKQGAQAFAQTAAGQVSGSQPAQGTNEQANSAQTAQQQMTDKDRIDFLRNLYGKSTTTEAPADAKALAGKQRSPQRTPEELAKIEALRKQLHGDYYQSLVNPPKPKEEPVTEKLEREEQEQKFEELEKEKKKPPPLPATVKQGTGERLPGVSG